MTTRTRKPRQRLTDLERYQRSETEASFQQSVIELAESLGYLVFHVYDSRRSNAGFPDLVMVRGDVCIFCELKREGQKPRREQIVWGQALKQVKVVRAFWACPSDLDAIRKLLIGEG